MSNSYKRFPALAAYIDGIEAVQFSHRRYGVPAPQTGKYRRWYAYIRLEEDGAINVSGDQAKRFLPTDAQRDAIAAEAKAAQAANNWFPRSITTTRAKATELRAMLRKRYRKEPELFEVVDQYPERKDQDVICVRERIDDDEGGKDFITWTYFPDDKEPWQVLEPDGGMPFYKPRLEAPREAKRSRKRPRAARNVRGGRMIMIHEGEGKAKACNDLKDHPAKLAAHPWPDLAKFDHWAITSGAHRTAQMRWAELIDEKPVLVVYVCDNDDEGMEAAQSVSRHYGRSLRVIFFDERWKAGFDLADDFPPEMFKTLPDGAKKYIGPAMHELMMLATQATKLVVMEGSDKPVAVLTRDFEAEIVHCIEPEVFIVRGLDQIMSSEQFNNLARPFSHVDDTARLVKKIFKGKGHALSYSPAHPAGFYSVDGKRHYNTFTPPLLDLPKGKLKKDAAKPWEDFLEHLIPIERDRWEMKRWCATLIARIDIKMVYGVLLISETQGVGKSTLGERILAPLVGASNVSYPSEHEIVDSNYNYWAAHKRLAVVNEIYAGQSAKAYNRLKNIITDRHITISKKYQANYDIENWIHIFACSNSKRALRLVSGDRRWFVPKVTEQKKPREYWEQLNEWLTVGGGLAIIRQWAIDFCAKDGGAIKRGETAPDTDAKKELIEEQMSAGQSLIKDWLDDIEAIAKAHKKVPIVSDQACIKKIKLEHYEGRQSDKLEKPRTIQRLAKDRNWEIGPEKINVIRGENKGQLMSPDRRYVVNNKGEAMTLKDLDPIASTDYRAKGKKVWLVKSPDNAVILDAAFEAARDAYRETRDD